MLADRKNVEQAGGWYFASRPMRDPSAARQFIAWCARVPHLGEGPLDVPLSLDCHFEFGCTAEDALRKLKAEVLH